MSEVKCRVLYSVDKLGEWYKVEKKEPGFFKYWEYVAIFNGKGKDRAIAFAQKLRKDGGVVWEG